MTRGLHRFLPAAALALSLVPAVHAQTWRLRLDARAQMAAFRGVELDSLHARTAVGWMKKFRSYTKPQP